MSQSFNSPVKTGRTIDVLTPYRRHEKVEVISFLPHAFKMSVKLPRIKTPSKNEPCLFKTQEDRLLHNMLPVYMHNHGTRHGANSQHNYTIRDLNIRNHGLLDPPSFINARSEFRVDPKTGQKIGVKPILKEKPTFAELLMKNGFFVNDSAKVKRNRLWHVKKIPNLEQIEQDESDEDYL